MARVPGVREDAQRVEGHVCGQDRGREAADALGGRGYYEHGADRRGYRNGNRLGKVKTVEGEIECSGLVSVRSSAKIIGTLKSGRLVVYPGAVIETEIKTENL